MGTKSNVIILKEIAASSEQGSDFIIVLGLTGNFFKTTHPISSGLKKKITKKLSSDEGLIHQSKEELPKRLSPPF